MNGTGELCDCILECVVIQVAGVLLQWVIASQQDVVQNACTPYVLNAPLDFVFNGHNKNEKAFLHAAENLHTNGRSHVIACES